MKVQYQIRYKSSILPICIKTADGFAAQSKNFQGEQYFVIKSERETKQQQDAAWRRSVARRTYFTYKCWIFDQFSPRSGILMMKRHIHTHVFISAEKFRKVMACMEELELGTILPIQFSYTTTQYQGGRQEFPIGVANSMYIYFLNNSFGHLGFWVVGFWGFRAVVLLGFRGLGLEG